MGTWSISPGDWAALGAGAVPGAPALRLPDGSAVTYAELDGAASRVARELRGRGLAKGDRLAVLSTDTPDLVVLVLAALKLGVILVPLNYRLTADDLRSVLETVRPAALALGPRYLPLRDDLTRGLRALVLGLDGADGCDLAVGGAPGDADADPLRAVPEDGDVLLWLLTSGTTRAPKLVAQSQRMIKANVVKGAIEHGFGPDETVYAGSPLFHAAGLGWLWYALSRGAAFLLLPQFDVAVLARCLRQGVLTRCMLVPSMAVELLDREAAGGPFPGLRSISYGGAAATPALVERLHRAFGADLYNTFGAGTECGGQSILRPADHRRAFAGEPRLLASIGRPMFGVELEIRDELGRRVADGAVGEIWTRSDSIMDGYVGRDDLTAQRLSDGWIHNGDLAWRDAEGYLFLVGRDDDVIMRGGEKINPLEVENVLAAHPDVAESAVVGLPDAYWGHVVVAAVVGRPGVEPDVAGIEALAASELPSYKRPVFVAVVDALPRNGSGKTVRARVAERLGELRAARG